MPTLEAQVDGLNVVKSVNSSVCSNRELFVGNTAFEPTYTTPQSSALSALLERNAVQCAECQLLSLLLGHLAGCQA